MTKNKLAVIAIGGNSLINDESTSDRRRPVSGCQTRPPIHIADMIEQGWDVAIGHGNGPQVGFILRRSEIAAKAGGHARSPAGCMRCG